jgi:hypothetical protein
METLRRPSNHRNSSQTSRFSLSISSNERGFGPGFQSSTSRLFRAEYALISVTIVAYLVWSYHSGIGRANLVVLLFFGALPDLASFVPIGLASSKGTDKETKWPSWGADVYNLFHTILIWALVFASVWILLRTPFLPLLGWLLHITVDRSVGYTLRSRK